MFPAEQVAAMVVVVLPREVKTNGSCNQLSAGLAEACHSSHRHLHRRHRLRLPKAADPTSFCLTISCGHRAGNRPLLPNNSRRLKLPSQPLSSAQALPPPLLMAAVVPW